MAARNADRPSLFWFVFVIGLSDEDELCSVGSFAMYTAL